MYAVGVIEVIAGPRRGDPAAVWRSAFVAAWLAGIMSTCR
jgi:hypothetical protein